MYNPTLRDIFSQVPCNLTQHRQWRKQLRMNIINDYFINKLSKSCFNFTIVCIGTLEHLETSHHGGEIME
jgi:hypothetical protein